MFKKQKAILAGIFALILILSSLSACAAKPEESDNPSASNPSKEIETLKLPTEFKAFECSADDYINYDCRINDSAFKFKNNTLYLKKGENEDKEIFRLEADLIAVAYVKNALFLSTKYNRASDNDENNAVIDDAKTYRIEIDENGKYNKNTFSLIAEYPSIPSFVFKENILCLSAMAYHDAFHELIDTQSGLEVDGEMIDVHQKLNEGELPEGAISKEKASEIAFEEAMNKKYYSNDKKYEMVVSEAQPYLRPDAALYFYSRWGLFSDSEATKNTHTEWQYDTIPKYCWIVQIDSAEKADGVPQPRLLVLVNAQTGEIPFVECYSDATHSYNINFLTDEFEEFLTEYHKK